MNSTDRPMYSQERGIAVEVNKKPQAAINEFSHQTSGQRHLEMEGAAGSRPPLSAGSVWKLCSVFLGARGSRQ